MTKGPATPTPWNRCAGFMRRRPPRASQIWPSFARITSPAVLPSLVRTDSNAPLCYDSNDEVTSGSLFAHSRTFRFRLLPQVLLRRDDPGHHGGADARPRAADCGGFA